MQSKKEEEDKKNIKAMDEEDIKMFKWFGYAPYT